MALQIGILVAIFVATFGLMLLLLGGRSPESTRLMEVTEGTRGAALPTARGRWRTVLDAEHVAKAAGPLRSLLGAGQSEELARRLSMAGFRKPVHADVFFLARAALPILGIVAVTIFVKENLFFYVIVVAAAGYLLPDFWLTYAANARRERIRLSLPDALDLMVICLEAGLGLDQALMRVGQELRITHRDISEEFSLIGLEQRAGKPRVEAWRHMAERSGSESVRQFVHMLVQTERFGTPISKSLANFSEALRVRRRQQAEEMAAKTTIKLIPPLVLFIFPSLFIVLLAPALITIAKNLGQAFSSR